MSNKKGYRLPQASKLEKLGLKREWIEPWDMTIDIIDRIDSLNWRLWTNRGEKLLRRVEWPEEKIRLICAFLDHLGKSGYRNIPRFIRTADGRRWIPGEGNSFYLCDYVDSIPLNLQDRQELDAAFRVLSQLHGCAESFLPPEGGDLHRSKVPWNIQWEEDLQKLGYYRGLASSGQQPSAFDEVFSEQSHLLASQIDYALRLLALSEYGQMIQKDGCEILCHGYYKEPHVRMTHRGEVYIDHFDRCQYNLKAYDLGRILYRVLAGCNWSVMVGQQCLESYQELRNLTQQEKQTLVAFLCFPHPAVAYLHAYYDNRSGYRPRDLVSGLRQEALNQGGKERFLDWALKWSS